MNLYWICKNGLDAIPSDQKEKNGVFGGIYYCQENDFTEVDGQRIYHGLPMDESDGKCESLRNVNITSTDFFLLTTSEVAMLTRKKGNAYNDAALELIKIKAIKNADTVLFGKLFKI